MIKFQSIFLTLSGIILTSFLSIKESVSGYAITKKMIENTSNINTLTYTLSKEERFNGSMVKQVSFTKMDKDPFCVYMKQTYPEEGMEVLYVKGQNNDKALINPNGFPWINVKLKPTDGIMRHQQHHTIFQSGYDHVVSILDFLCNKYQDDIDNIVRYNGLVKHGEKNCHSISFHNPNFKYIDYSVQKNETLEDIASKFKLSEHMILEKNEVVKDYNDVEPGQIIKIPNDYSPKMLLYIDTQDLIPIRIEVYDEKGLYEKYEYSEVSINPKFSTNEFSKDYPEYGF